MLKNLAKLDQTEMDKVNVDLAAAGVALDIILAEVWVLTVVCRMRW